MKPLMNTLESVYVIIYFAVAIIAGIILLPLSFLLSKPHFEYDGYDK